VNWAGGAQKLFRLPRTVTPAGGTPAPSCPHGSNGAGHASLRRAWRLSEAVMARSLPPSRRGRHQRKQAESFAETV